MRVHKVTQLYTSTYDYINPATFGYREVQRARGCMLQFLLYKRAHLWQQ